MEEEYELGYPGIPGREYSRKYDYSREYSFEPIFFVKMQKLYFYVPN